MYHDAPPDEYDTRHDDVLSEPSPDTPRGLQAVMGWLYDRAVSGIAGIESAATLAERYLDDAGGDAALAARNMIRWESIKAGSSGFLSGAGGLAALPLTLPLNITSVLFIQTRLVAALACLGGHSLSDERIRALCGLCLCGNAAKALLQDMIMKMAEQWTPVLTCRVAEKTLVLMLARTGMSTGGQLVRLLPLAGGVVSGTVDAVSTRTIGHLAFDTFLHTPAPGLP